MKSDSIKAYKRGKQIQTEESIANSFLQEQIYQHGHINNSIVFLVNPVR